MNGSVAIPNIRVGAPSLGGFEKVIGVPLAPEIVVLASTVYALGVRKLG